MEKRENKVLIIMGFSKNVFITCPKCGENIRLDLSDLKTKFKDDKEFCKVCYTHGIFQEKGGHTLIIDIDRNFDPRTLSVADITFNMVGQ